MYIKLSFIVQKNRFKGLTDILKFVLEKWFLLDLICRLGRCLGTDFYNIGYLMFWFVKGSICSWRGWTKACETRGNEGEAFSPR